MHAEHYITTMERERADAERDAEMAHEIEMAAERFRRSIEARDLMSDAVDVTDDDPLLLAIQAGRFDEAGREWSRRVADYCVRCAEQITGARPTVRADSFDRLTGRDEWAGPLRGLEARFMPLGEK